MVKALGAVHPDGNRILTASDDKRMLFFGLWDLGGTVIDLAVQQYNEVTHE